ncbi:hypothetical protein HYV79_00240 [Candidatus Woesearchaeota archaeon]|nr:hypothetical protein [Candidatus Woesearchaeota archaeon]
MDRPIHIRAIIEILGAPKEYIENTLKNYIEKLKKEGTNLLSEVYHEAIPQQKLFSTFAEVEILFQKPNELLNFCFDAMPSSIEILSPEHLMFNAVNLNDFLNDLQARVHQADLIVKNFKAQNNILDQNTQAIFNNFIVYLLKQGPKTLEELSQPVGLTPAELLPFVKKLEEKKRVNVENGKYVLQGIEKHA